MEEQLITLFIPAKALESSLNTYPGATIENKINLAMRRYISNNNFVSGDIKEETPSLFINKYYFDPHLMGYNVIAKIL